MFTAFLSDDMTYSYPIWKLNSSADEEDETLVAAEMTKLHRFIAGARIKPTDHVSESERDGGHLLLRQCGRLAAESLL